MDAAATTTWPWNRGQAAWSEAPLKLEEIRAIRIRLQLDHRARELALFNLTIDSKTKFELIISGKTAKTLGLTITPELLLKAD